MNWMNFLKVARWEVTFTMPSKPRFEAFDINDLIFGGKVKMLSMIEISEVFFNHINMALQLLDDGKTVSIEIPNDDALYHLSKKDEETFLLEKCGHDVPKAELDAINTVNWLFARAPFISLVGYSNI